MDAFFPNLEFGPDTVISKPYAAHKPERCMFQLGAKFAQIRIISLWPPPSPVVDCNAPITHGNGFMSHLASGNATFFSGIEFPGQEKLGYASLILWRPPKDSNS